MISDMMYYIACCLLVIGILTGISWMSTVKMAIRGNYLSAVCIAFATLLTLLKYDIISDLSLSVVMAVSLVFSIIWIKQVKMIAMPQLVALLNGFGGAAAALVGAVFLIDAGKTDVFSFAAAGMTVAVGMVTLTGSLVAAGKLHGCLSQKPTFWPMHQALTMFALTFTLVFIGLIPWEGFPVWVALSACTVISGFFGVAFVVRVGGADMPVVLSLLISLSGFSCSGAGMATGDPLLTAIGGIVGASGLLLTQIMCRAMNRSLPDILMGKTTVAEPKASGAEHSATGAAAGAKKTEGSKLAPEAAPVPGTVENKADLGEILRQAKRVIIIPGYGMALAQAQLSVKELADKLEQRGASVDFAIHPVAGRMPGHMNVLLAEVDVSYDKLREMDDINPEFANCDAAIIIGANDVVNPAAREAVGTPIYGMPILSVDDAKNVIICNYDLKPGYSGVENPLYNNKKVFLLLGDAADTVKDLISKFN